MSKQVWHFSVFSSAGSRGKGFSICTSLFLLSFAFLALAFPLWSLCALAQRVVKFSASKLADCTDWEQREGLAGRIEEMGRNL
ncbi:MAG TPA: hypothetical protein VKT32_12545 [Chthonomonadaceae bacterium]|nr:hypothetical protein [Chthonomonadaceae bacterium]